MIPLFKLMIIFAKTFTKPVVGIMKKMTFNNKSFIRNYFIALGNLLNRVEVRINRRFIGVQNIKDQEIPNLPDDKAFENASNFILEVVFLYGVLLTIAVSEVIKSIEEKKAMKQDLSDMKSTIQNLKDELAKIEEIALKYKTFFEDIQRDQNQLITGVSQFKALVQEQEAKRECLLKQQEEYYKQQLTLLRRDINVGVSKPNDKPSF